MSEWKAGAAARRDERATKTDEIPGRTPSRKNTKRWCRGKVGKEHVPMIQISKYWVGKPVCDPQRTWWPCSHSKVCTVCGKQLNFSLPISECPDLNKK